MAGHAEWIGGRVDGEMFAPLEGGSFHVVQSTQQRGIGKGWSSKKNRFKPLIYLVHICTNTPRKRVYFRLK